jgi:hypothetical protein
MVNFFYTSAGLQNLLNDHKGSVGAAEIYADKFKVWLGFWGLLVFLACSSSLSAKFSVDQVGRLIARLRYVLSQRVGPKWITPLSSSTRRRVLLVLV